MSAERVRRPERHDPRYYEDTGCILHPSCLSCPFPVCVHDIPGGIPALRRIVREGEIRQRRTNGEALAEIAGTVGIAVRTVTRLLGERGAMPS